MVDLVLVVEADGAHAAGPAVGLGLLTRELAAVGLPAHVVALPVEVVVGPASPAAATTSSTWGSGGCPSLFIIIIIFFFYISTCIFIFYAFLMFFLKGIF